MASIEDIRTALAAALTTMGLRPVQELDKAVSVSGGAVAATIDFAGADYLTVFGGQGDTLNFNVLALASRVDERAGRLKLDALVDPDPASTTSMRNGLGGNLGGVVAVCNVTSASEYRNYPLGDAGLLGCQFAVTVMT